MRKPFFNFLFRIFILVLIILSSTGTAQALLVIDPGHGGSDPGAVASLESSSALEKDLNLKVAKLVSEKLSRLGFKTSLTREGDVTVSLQQRVSFANSMPTDFFISIHHNSCSDPQVGGVEAYYYLTNSNGKKLAQMIASYISTSTGLKNRGARPTSSLYVITNTKATAVLVECGFMSNPEELKKLVDPRFQEILADAISRAISDFVYEFFLLSGFYERIYGETRIDTSVLLSNKFCTTASSVIVANGYSYADALAASSLCGFLDCPLLLLSENADMTKVSEEIKRLGASKIYAIGGSPVISDKALKTLKLNTNCEIERIYGRDRFETASKIALKIAEKRSVDGVFIVNAYSQYDSLSCANLSALTQRPILFVRENIIPFFTNLALSSLKEKNPELEVVAIGGQAVIGEDVITQLKGIRIGGRDRYETNLLVQTFGLQRGIIKSENIFLVCGSDPVDALSLSSSVRRLLPLIIYTREVFVPLNTFKFLSDLSPPAKKFFVLGGPNLITEQAVKQLSIAWLNE